MVVIHSHKNSNMTQRIAPNNQLPATHFIEVYKSTVFGTTNQQDAVKNPSWINLVEIFKIDELDFELRRTKSLGYVVTTAIFRIRENKLPTKHNFNK